METSEASTDIVHPEVRAHVNSLVSALGGFGADDDGRYVLGDSALEVLKDIKKWIRFYDEKTNRFDVARCLARANLVEGDLLHILASWPENATDNRFKSRAALACFEILVPLTWPLERELDQMTVNHHRHLPVLQLAQVAYKRAIINFDAAQILHTAVRVALPSMALSRGERSARDEGIIKLVLLFLRNIALISTPPGVKDDGDELQISRSALIDAFSYQDILLTILTIASNMGDDFNQEGVVLMEIIFHLVKRVDVNKLFMTEKQLSKAKSNELATMMSKEAAMHRPYNRKAPTRHNRWGTMIWVDRGDGKMSTVTGQDALLDTATRQQKMDSSKIFRPPRRPKREEMEPKDLGPPVTLNTRARQQLKGFVEEFLDSGFNPLFQHIRKKLDEQKDYIFEYHSRQFFYLISWFLETERVRKAAAKSTQTADSGDVGSFNLVAGVLNQQMFITLNRAMGDAMENKRWQELCSAMRCFTQILLTVQEMSESGNEEDEEIAENILSRIFYEEDTYDRIANIAKTYKDQGFEYLDACTELTHTYLRVLESYSKQNVDMQVRSKRRVRKKKKKAAKAGGPEPDENPAEELDDSDNDEASAAQTSRERKFDFSRFSARFIPQGVVDTFVSFTRYYQDLNDAQLKRAHRYFYRIAFKQEMSVMLFRLDIIQLFYSMIKGQAPLDKASPMFKDWEELVKQVLRRCFRKIDERPQLVIELLFSKLNATAHYLEYGYEKQTVSSAPARPGAELEFRHVVDRDRQIAIAVGALLDKNLAYHIRWVKEQLARATVERKAWEKAEQAMPSVEPPRENAEEPTEKVQPPKQAPVFSVRPDDDARRVAMFKNSHLRLLMKLVGFERLAPTLEETTQSAWIIPPSLSSDDLQDSMDSINRAEFDPPTFEDGTLAQDQLRRKTAPRKRAVFDDDNDGLGTGEDDDDDILFPAGGPTARKVAGDRPQKTRRRRRRRRGDGSGSDELDEEETTDETLEERAQARREREKAKAKRFKSELYVRESDDDSDPERWADFYAAEEKLRQRQQAAALKALSGSRSKPLSLLDDDDDAVSSAPEEEEKKKEKKNKRKARVFLEDSGDENDNDDDLVLSHSQESAATASVSASSRSKDRGLDDDEDEEEEGGGEEAGTDDTPLSSSPHAATEYSPSGAKRRRLSKEPPSPAAAAASGGEKTALVGMDEDRDMVDVDDDDEDEDVDVEPTSSKLGTGTQRRRPRNRMGFVVDSSDEE